MELGYPSSELFVLGGIGAIEGRIDKFTRYNKWPEKMGAEERQAVRGELAELKAKTWEKAYGGSDAALETFRESRKIIERHPELKGVYTFSNDAFALGVHSLAHRTKDMKAISSAMGEFNTKRTDFWLSSESKEHKSLRLAAEKMQRDMKAYTSGVYQEGADKGKFMSEADRLKYRDTIEKDIDAMTSSATAYIRAKSPSTEAGKARRRGAENLLAAANSIKADIEAQRSREAASVTRDRKPAGKLDALKDVIPGNDPLSNKRRKDLYEFRSISNLDFYKETIPGRNEYRMRFARVLAGQSLKKMVDDQKMQLEEAAKSIDAFSLKLEQDKTFVSMAKEAQGNINKKQEFARKNPAELFADYAKRRQSQMQQVTQTRSRDPQAEAQKQRGMRK